MPDYDYGIFKCKFYVKLKPTHYLNVLQLRCLFINDVEGFWQSIPIKLGFLQYLEKTFQFVCR